MDDLKPANDGTPVVVTYTNWRGVTSEKRLILNGGLRFGTTEWHNDPCWLVSGFDVDHPAKIWKEYDLSNMSFSQTITPQEAAKVLLADNLDFLTLRHKDNACLSYDHSFGLMDAEEQDRLRFQVKEWFRATLRAIAEGTQ